MNAPSTLITVINFQPVQTMWVHLNAVAIPDMREMVLTVEVFVLKLFRA